MRNITTRSLWRLALIFAVGPVTAFAEVPPLINYQGKIAVGGADFNGSGQFKFALVSGGVNLSQTATATATVVNGFVVGATVNSGGVGYSSAPTVTISGTGTSAQLTATVSGGAVTGFQVINAGSGYQAGTTTISVAAPNSNLSFTTYWSNDGSSTGGSQPLQPVSLPVSGGVYSVLLGDSKIPNMLPIPIDAFKNDDVRLRIWFSDGTNGFQLMTPDQRISAVGYAMIAANVPDGAITSNQLANGAVTGSKIATGSVAANQLAEGAVSSDKLAEGAVSSDKLAEGAVSSDKLAEGSVSSDKLSTGAVSIASALEGNILVRKEKSNDLESQGFVMIGSMNHTTLRIPEKAVLQEPDDHTAVWTGTETIFWGSSEGESNTNTGWRFNPTTNTLSTISTTGAPRLRGHTAVWTGKEMIVWGGYDDNGYRSNTGARYNPTTNTWTEISTADAPTPRSEHAVVWTGKEMIVWGGYDDNGSWSNTGARYNPTTNTWTATSSNGAPTLSERTVVWTGTEMIVWGNYYEGDYDYPLAGGRYNPTTDAWTAISTNGAPTSYSRISVWTGTEMIVWGGYEDTDGRYNPTTNAWTAISTNEAPTALNERSAVWTGTEMIVLGQDGNSALTGGRYNPTTNTWTAISTNGAPTLNDHNTVWTGTEMIVIVDRKLCRYKPTTDKWNMAGPIDRRFHSAIWTGTDMIVWGGSPQYDGECANTGWRYNTMTNNWSATSTVDAPTPRRRHAAVWTGKEMMVWGGYDDNENNWSNTGGRYNPITDTWTQISIIGAPRLIGQNAVWTGTEMIVWGGYQDNDNWSNTGGRYNPTTNTWTEISTIGAPRLIGHNAIWTGTEMIVWGGYNDNGNFNTGGRYNPITNAWTTISTAGAPTLGSQHTVVWTGTEMIVVGRDINSDNYAWTGGRYNPTTNTWIATSNTGLQDLSSEYSSEYDRVMKAVWTGTEMIVWGWDGFTDSYVGRRYNPVADVWNKLVPAFMELGETNFVRQPYDKRSWALKSRSGDHTAIWTGASMILFGGEGASEFDDSDGRSSTIEIITPSELYLYSKP
jgi:N-acetylneuraminic acid mutarotase